MKRMEYRVRSCKTDYLMKTVEERNSLAEYIMADNSKWFDKFMHLVNEYYKIEGNICGGNLHIVLDDGNLEDCHIQWCAGLAYGTGDHQGMDIADMMQFMTMKQRRRVYKGE